VKTRAPADRRLHLGMAVAGLSVLLAAAGGLRPQRAAAQSTDPAVVGQWGALMTWPIVAVHTHVLPTGKVMFYPYGDDARLWDPVTTSITALPRAGFNLFCTGHSFRPDGKLLVTGGHVENGWGLPNASSYDPFTNTWTPHPNMNNGRWYPTGVALAGGESLVVSGSYDVNYSNNTLPQVWSGSAWRNLTGAQMATDLFPAMHLAPNGKVLMTLPAQTTRYLDTTGAGAWSTVASRRFGYRGYGSSVLYGDGRVFVVGGADPPTATAEVLDLSAASPSWQFVAPMSVARRQINATLLADGKVLVTGGSSAAGFNEPSGAVLYGEIWDPATNTWTRTPDYLRYRGYHSTAVLLPDGRVLSAGGDNQPNAEVYSPPYLFKGARPSISSAPASVAYGQTFFVGTGAGTTPGTGENTDIANVHWIRLSSVTHATNMEQRINRLVFSLASGGLNVTAPSDPNLCPPGYYLLFILNGNGVPSAGRLVSIGGAAALPPVAPSGLTANSGSKSRINLAWTDNSGDEDGFKIERSTSASTGFSQIAVTGANITRYTDTQSRKNRTYYYRARAYGPGGHSGYSNIAGASTGRI
jgi:galactose oxidase